MDDGENNNIINELLNKYNYYKYLHDNLMSSTSDKHFFSKEFFNVKKN